MSNVQTSNPQQLQPPEEQELEIEEWVSKERSSGTVVRKELINWFAERVHHRDRTGYQVTSDYAGEFLHRHPDLAGRLIKPTPPLPKDERETIRPLAALRRQRMQQDRTRRMFGDNPPPERQPAPFPEGDIIHHIHNRYIIRHGNTITKITTNVHGFGRNDTPNEAVALRFIKANTTIPVPEVISSDWDRVTMEYVEGQTLQQAWPVLTPSQQSGILAQLRDYIAQMRSLSGTSLGRLDGQGVVVPSLMMERGGGPFGSLREFHDWLASPLLRKNARSMYWHQITTQLGADYPIVFTHADIAARNIMVRDGRIVAVIDWELAGWYPEYWEYVFAMRGLDNVDWETIGQHIPSLFDKRHDLEYILLGFILNL
ncbi:hypothetical protein KVR01_005892 [Diaporthe batatas]|uniref:uncharacterized protein n=1 Tax=Diaporthe batatas TaxID=748121 RepID=UPI001D059698|nr:uncharacterized protein KVR01_005892 [Diaporthe batatas]KAG8163974.1 hypothetical protein KVR01_005892 [Diaporthe batatas]